MKKIIALLAFWFLASPASAQKFFFELTAKNDSYAGKILSARLNSSGTVVAFACFDKVVRLADTRTLQFGVTMKAQGITTTSIAFSGDSKLLATGTSAGRLLMWETVTGTFVRVYEHDAGIYSVDMDQQGRVISGGVDKETKMWEGTSDNAVRFPVSTADVTQVAFSNDGKNVFAGCSDGSINVYDAFVPTQVLRTMSNHRLSVRAIAFSPDNKFVATGGNDSLICLWNAQTGSLISSWKEEQGPVTSLTFYPNNKWIVSAAYAIRFRDVESGKILASLPENGGYSQVLVPQDGAIIGVGINGALWSYSVTHKKPDAQPPIVTLLQPKIKENETLQLYASAIEVSGIVADESEIQWVKINDAEASLTDAPTQQKTGNEDPVVVKNFKLSVPLPSAGQNTLVISASDVEGNTTTQSVKLTKLSKEAAVEVVTPKENLETDAVTVSIEFKTWFDYLNYAIMLNSIEISRKDNIPRKPIGTLHTETISLQAGYNQVMLTVNGRGGEKIQRTINITRRVLSSPVAASSDNKPRQTTGQPQTWAVIVGVSQYQNPAIKNLAYADRDAQAFADFLRSDAGGRFEENHVRLLLNKEATLQNVKLALNNFLRQSIDKDLVIIYFAGHGAPEPANANNNYLLCHDTDPNSLETTAFPMWDVKTALERYIPSKRVVVFTDACHSGGISTDLATRGMSSGESNMVNQYLAALSASKEGTIVFTASQAGEVSQELQKFGHGVFTYYLLEGLKGAADYNNDYTVTIGELMDFVEEKVKRETNGNQHPTRNQGNYDKDMTIGLVPH